MINLTLESVSPSQIARERKRRSVQDEIARRIQKPIRRSGCVNVQPLFDLGQTGQMDLFNPIDFGGAK